MTNDRRELREQESLLGGYRDSCRWGLLAQEEGKEDLASNEIDLVGMVVLSEDYHGEVLHRCSVETEADGVSLLERIGSDEPLVCQVGYDVSPDRPSSFISWSNGFEVITVPQLDVENGVAGWSAGAGWRARWRAGRRRARCGCGCAGVGRSGRGRWGRRGDGGCEYRYVHFPDGRVRVLILSKPEGEAVVLATFDSPAVAIQLADVAVVCAERLRIARAHDRAVLKFRPVGG